MESNRQAGYELDRLVAEKLFRKLDLTAEVQFSDKDWFAYHHDLGFFHYSTDWNSMRLVVEEMQRRGLLVYMEHNPDGTTLVQVVRDAIDALDLLGDGESDNVPYAVCIAALAALKALEADTHE